MHDAPSEASILRSLFEKEIRDHAATKAELEHERQHLVNEVEKYIRENHPEGEAILHVFTGKQLQEHDDEVIAKYLTITKYLRTDDE